MTIVGAASRTAGRVQSRSSTNPLYFEDHGIRDTTLVDDLPFTERRRSDPVAVIVDEQWRSVVLSYDIGEGDVERLTTIIGDVHRKARFSRAFYHLSACHPCPHES